MSLTLLLTLLVGCVIMFVKAEEIAIWIDRWLRSKEHTLLSFALTPGDTEIMHGLVGETKMFPKILLRIPWVRNKYQKLVDSLHELHMHTQGNDWDYVTGWDLQSSKEEGGEPHPVGYIGAGWEII